MVERSHLGLLLGQLSAWSPAIVSSPESLNAPYLVIPGASDTVVAAALSLGVQDRR